MDEQVAVFLYSIRRNSSFTLSSRGAALPQRRKSTSERSLFMPQRLVRLSLPLLRIKK
ncbi:hypothetical protein [Paraburkholderia rhynchosiae]|uniref:hypothetical protein n=1 Tax=Paraburkholderia rhynchosiae TaxID=487049 RepID=UPI001304F01E|nr:hypothetical protein [Paraburkholderia rhynchosiae]